MVDPKTRGCFEAGIEALLRAKYEAGEIDTGLFSTKGSWVVMDKVDGEFQFQWFEEALDLDQVSPPVDLGDKTK